MTFRKMMNRSDPAYTLASKVESAVQLFGALKSVWDVEQGLVDAGRALALCAGAIATPV